MLRSGTIKPAVMSAVLCANAPSPSLPERARWEASLSRSLTLSLPVGTYRMRRRRPCHAASRRGGGVMEVGEAAAAAGDVGLGSSH